MANVIVIGAGLGGLSAAMLLALDGHDVTVVERDPAGPPDSADEAWESWERRGVNQFRLPHFTLARWREVLERELPGVVTALEERGAIRWNPMKELPPALTGGPRDGDERYESLTARRPTLDWAVSDAAGATYGLTVRRGVAVAGLLTGDPTVAGIPHVVGVRTANGEDLRADLVVDSTGRRSPLPGWLDAAGARRPPEELEDSGFVYYGRHFRSGDGSIPPAHAPVLQPYDSVSVLTLPGDNGTWSVTFIASAADRELSSLRDPERFHAAIARYPLAAHWAEAEPTSGVAVMAKLEDRYRRFVVDGEPVATGVVAVADAWACTNPSLGRGAAIGLVHACCLRDLLREVPAAEPYKLAARWDDVTEEVVTPLYRSTLTYDRHRLAEVDAQRAGRAYETDDPTWAITRAFATAAQRDTDVLRHFYDVISVFALPTDALAVPGAMDKILEHGGDGSQPALFPGPDRAELLATLRA